MQMKEFMRRASVRPFLKKARFGLERESQRVTLQGELAKTDHPSILGNREFHPYIQTDFSETQVEMITPVADTAKEMLRFLAAIQDVTMRSLPKEEMLWPLSMPPALPEKEEDIIIAKLDKFEDVLYRRYLAKEYGKRKQMVSGIHFNFEFADGLVRQLFNEQTAISSFDQFKTEIYMKVSRNFLRYRWLVTYLYGASPVSEARYFENEPKPEEPVRSIRSSKYGYTNHEDVTVSYESLETYVQNIAEMIETGKLSEEKEFYAPLRLRGGKKMSELATHGIRYIELRSIDVNPFERLGISEEQIQFLHIFMLYLLWTEEKHSADEWVAIGDLLNNQVALENPLEQTELLEEGEVLFAEMLAMLEELELTEEAELIRTLQKQLTSPEDTLSGQLLKESQASSQKKVAVAFAQNYYQEAHERPYQLAGFREMELSTQILFFDAIQKGISVTVLDEMDQFLKLQHKEHVEYVKNANMTSKDSYVVPLMMENKTVTKKILAEAGFRVPKGAEFANMEEAQRAYPEFAKTAFVVKPKSTNYGLGISIFKEGASKEDYQTALEIAFAEDTEVLLEEFLPGTEYRFFVLDGKVRAILLRVPANVVGDGERTVEALVAEKNQDPLRGTHHRSPLELIQLGTLEKLMLKEQGLTVDSIPENNQVVYLRENSNISTGGDSIDVTETFTDAYKKIAVDAVEALGAKISGIDLIIPDQTIDPTKEANAYGIIEANFNPAMHMHIYPYQGTGRRLTMDVLHLLYPEVV
ncbi:glutamate-cysteine ligase/gamma-glutamylcysteine synthetase [Enterococcus phoeniculicola]|uniref:Glutathione biosynthesis bifunctional protein GshAB n=1 Tax=Enterococcus phoeniculicola ATCC BAA-412 TaxID=1158610 RepID=R3TV19_9ENTE|nr:bifunctional glutamate--cysteine ligase GshA/glutathione synthetase GshB [Enterococcus phoeniculicola]EOL45439.1 glutamate-cysteine ligase/gamma-glutamylcysteine synthetase [Enterococcus phoeniculicola ATCC BAA-412]EOT74801.1 glutamate-cysteine ligase/gamma-glutamylcysteine synthetase [Enterococcus phoeniculicola ATCC BAA-412]OJG73762.1 glutamate-cysteine ligase/gamma-glutamylcysteine synthetase [Enterococcus phoeniculicola]